MGKAHAHAFRTLSHMTWPPPLVPRLEKTAGRNEEASSPMTGCSCSTTSAPHDLHAEPTIAAARGGKHVVCEKPLGRTA